jgi:hypothetical protein
VLGRPLAAIRRKIENAVVDHRLRRRPPPVAGPEEIDAQLDALFAHLLELAAPGCDLADLDQNVADTCARMEEWTA